MTVPTFEGSVDTLQQGEGDPVAAEAGVSAAGLLMLATVYQTAQYRVSRSAERQARDLWRRAQPLNDAELSAWMGSWNTILAGAAAQQSLLTASYLRSSMGQFGVTIGTPSRVAPADPQVAAGWLSSEYAQFAPQSLRDEAARVADELASTGFTTPAGAALVDRLPFLHSPVIKQRWRISEGMDYPTAAEETSSFVEAATYDAGRAVERVIMGAQRWPTFQNGVAMMYRRVPQAGACGWCWLVATRVYSLESFKATGGQTNTPAPWHAACRCTWAPLTFTEATNYANTLARSRGDYYAAAGQIGAWTGPPPEDYVSVESQRFDKQQAAEAGYESRQLTAEERQRWLTNRPTARPRTARAATRLPRSVIDPAIEARAAALAAEGNGLAAQARQAVADGNSAEAKRLYDRARVLTSQALRLRQGQSQ